MGQLDGKVAAITGGTRGIGRGIAEAFLREGAKVALNGRSQDKGDKALAELGAGDRAVFFAGDVCQKADCEAFIEQTVATFGTLDILVANAGGAGGFAPVAEMSDESWQQAIDWNLNHTFWTNRKALSVLLAKGSGRIINMSSVEGKHGKPGLVQYSAMKHAINGFSKALAKEVGTLGVTVNTLCPGLILTDIVMESGGAAAAAMGKTFDEMVELFASESALKRPNTVDEVAAVAVLLASDAGAGITGATMSVDGGTAAY